MPGDIFTFRETRGRRISKSSRLRSLERVKSEKGLKHTYVVTGQVRFCAAPLNVRTWGHEGADQLLGSFGDAGDGWRFRLFVGLFK